MRYVSTRDKNHQVSAAEAIVKGLSPDGGLFVPASIPVVGLDFFKTLLPMDYAGRAAAVFALYLDEFSKEELLDMARRSYGPDRFETGIAPVSPAYDGISFLELFHGPTSAFKDMALQILPRLLRMSLQECGETRTVLILTATSGDTGKAALEGFCDVPGCKALVYYPKDGVSRTQELQMVTQKGDNVGVCAIAGNFDDAQRGVKALFSDSVLADQMAQKGIVFSSANSINWGRLLPQIAYYIAAYLDMAQRGDLTLGDPLDVAVPTGNFGNILACYMAKRMGLPIGQIICASNQNDVLTDLIRTGIYDRKRPFYNTLSPSMDILVSSNWERALYFLSGEDDVLTRGCMDALTAKGRYELPPEVRQTMQAQFCGGCGNDGQTRQTIAAYYQKHGVLIDPHTAVACYAAGPYRTRTPLLVVSTASPFKFSGAVLSALGQTGDTPEQLSAATGLPIPKPLRDLDKRPIRFTQTVDPGDMERAVWQMVDPGDRERAVLA